MACADIDFPLPRVILIVGKNPPRKKLLHTFVRHARTLDPTAQCLTVECAARHARSIQKALRLCDVAGIYVHDDLAKSLKGKNVLVRSGKKIHAYSANTLDIAATVLCTGSRGASTPRTRRSGA